MPVPRHFERAVAERPAVLAPTVLAQPELAGIVEAEHEHGVAALNFIAVIYIDAIGPRRGAQWRVPIVDEILMRLVTQIPWPKLPDIEHDLFFVVDVDRVMRQEPDANPVARIVARDAEAGRRAIRQKIARRNAVAVRKATLEHGIMVIIPNDVAEVSAAAATMVIGA